MALITGTVDIEDTATEISFASHGGLTVLIQNDTAMSVFLGDSEVTIYTGYELKVGQTISYDLLTDDSIYGVVDDTQTTTVRVTWLGR